MASNKDLMAEITTLSAQLGVAVPDGLEQVKNPRLLEILDGLKQAPLPASVVETPLRPLVATTPPEDVAAGAASEVPPVAVVADAPPMLLAPAPLARAPLAATKSPATGAPGYFVTEGKTVNTSHREVQGAFQQVYASDFADGQAQIEAYLASGYLFKR